MIADARVNQEISDDKCEVFLKVINKCLLRYNKRPTANEVSLFAVTMARIRLIIRFWLCGNCAE